MVEFKRDCSIVLRPLKKIVLRLSKPELEDLVLSERNVLKYKLYQ